MVSSPLLLPRNPSSNGLTSNPNFLSLKLSLSFSPRELVYALVICVCLALLISVLWSCLLCSVKGENSTSFNLWIFSVMLRVPSFQFGVFFFVLCSDLSAKHNAVWISVWFPRKRRKEKRNQKTIRLYVYTRNWFEGAIVWVVLFLWSWLFDISQSFVLDDKIVANV